MRSSSRLSACANGAVSSRRRLIQNGGSGILEKNVGIRIAAIKFFGNFNYKVVVGVFAFQKPWSMRRTFFNVPSGRTVLSRRGSELSSYEQQIARAGVGVDEIEDGAADGGFLGAAAESDNLIHFETVGMNGARFTMERSLFGLSDSGEITPGAAR